MNRGRTRLVWLSTGAVLGAFTAIVFRPSDASNALASRSLESQTLRSQLEESVASIHSASQVVDTLRTNSQRLEIELSNCVENGRQLSEKLSSLQAELHDARGRLETSYYPSGARRSEGLMRDGVKEGTWTEWSEAGKVISSAEFHYGKLSGTFVRWDSTGRMVETGTYFAELKQGNWTYWNEDSQSWSTIFYEGGVKRD